jgi:hypothetical protein
MEVRLRSQTAAIRENSRGYLVRKSLPLRIKMTVSVMREIMTQLWGQTKA